MPREWKKKDIEEMTELLDSYPVVGIINMHKLPGPQLQEMRKDLHGKAKIRMSRKTLMKFALEKCDREGIKELEDHFQGEVAFLFTEMNPFRLCSYLQRNKSSAPAKTGDIAPKDIKVKAGNTGIDPGPAIGKLQAAGIRTKIDDGKIHVQKDSVVAENGEEITPDIAEALNMLDMEPMEIGLNLKAVWEDGTVFMPSDLDIDVESYRRNIISEYRKGINLSINSGYVTKETAPLLIRKAWIESLSLAIESNYPTEDTIEELVRKAFSEGKALKSKVEDLEN